MTEPYVCITVPKKYRSAYAKFRCGVAPIKLETCRYGISCILNIIGLQVDYYISFYVSYYEQ